MKRVLNRFYIARDFSNYSWAVFEHTNKLFGSCVKTNLTYDEAKDYAHDLNEKYEKGLLT